MKISQIFIPVGCGHLETFLFFMPSKSTYYVITFKSRQNCPRINKVLNGIDPNNN